MEPSRHVTFLTFICQALCATTTTTTEYNKHRQNRNSLAFGKQGTLNWLRFPMICPKNVISKVALLQYYDDAEQWPKQNVRILDMLQFNSFVFDILI